MLSHNWCVVQRGEWEIGDMEWWYWRGKSINKQQIPECWDSGHKISLNINDENICSTDRSPTAIWNFWSYMESREAQKLIYNLQQSSYNKLFKNIVNPQTSSRPAGSSSPLRDTISLLRKIDKRLFKKEVNAACNAVRWMEELDSTVAGSKPK